MSIERPSVIGHSIEMAPHKNSDQPAATAQERAVADLVKAPRRTRPGKAVSLSKLKSSTARVKCPVSPTVDNMRIAGLEKELERVCRRADARGKEADSLRKRVQELEPEVRRLENDLEKRRDRRLLRSPRDGRQPGGSSSPTRIPANEGNAALRGRLAAAENRAKILELRCDQLNDNRDSRLKKVGVEETDGEEGGVVGCTLGASVDDEGYKVRDKEHEATRIKKQLEVAERRVKNSHYINEAHESVAAKAAAREQEANIRADELGRKLNRALEKLESIGRRDLIMSLRASCIRDKEGIHLAERELRAYQMDPELYLPANTAKRRQLARSEQRLHRLRLRYTSQSAALSQVQATEQQHSDLRRAAGCGDIPDTTKLLRSGLSSNVPDQAGLSAFLYACGQANAELVRVMIEAGGDVLDGNGSITGLIIAARKGAVDVVQTLLETGADVHARDSAGGTALHASTFRGHVDVSRVLLEAGSDCNAVDQGTNTPLHMLATSEVSKGEGCGCVGTAGTELVALLLEWGASTDIKSSKGLTPISAALDAGNRSLVLAYRDFFGEDEALGSRTDSAPGTTIFEEVAGTSKPNHKAAGAEGASEITEAALEPA